MAVEGEPEAERDGGRAPVRLGEHGVLLHAARRPVQRVEVHEGVAEVLRDARVVLVLIRVLKWGCGNWYEALFVVL